VNNNDERDYAEEAANRALLEDGDGELADYEIVPMRRPVQRDDPDLVADAMRALEGRILAAVPAGQRDQVQDLISDLLDLAPGQALTAEATKDAARHVLAVTDAEVNLAAKFYPQAADSQDTLPCVGLGGNEAGDGEVQVYVYREAGGLVISQHFDTAEGGPWAFYGQGQVPVTVIGGDGEPVYVANERTPDIREWARRGQAALTAYNAELTGDGVAGWAGIAEDLAGALTALLAAAGQPWQRDVQGGTEDEGGSEQ
jgi:hypothetical protein